MTAQYRCLGCGFEWLGEPGPVECPKCHHVYVKWVNFAQVQLIKYMIEHNYQIDMDAVNLVDRAMPEMAHNIAEEMNREVLDDMLSIASQSF